MNKKQQVEHLRIFQDEMAIVLLSKGDDYSNDDRLSNFKSVGKITGTSAEQACLMLIATKVARLGVLLNSKEKPKNESIRDSILDLANYCALLDMILSENTNNPVVTKTWSDFDSAMEAKIKELPYTKHLDDGLFNGGQVSGFDQGANWAYEYLTSKKEE